MIRAPGTRPLELPPDWRERQHQQISAYYDYLLEASSAERKRSWPLVPAVIAIGNSGSVPDRWIREWLSRRVAVAVVPAITRTTDYELNRTSEITARPLPYGRGSASVFRATTVREWSLADANSNGAVFRKAGRSANWTACQFADFRALLENRRLRCRSH